MSMSFEQVGLTLQVLGVLLVLLSQAVFAIRARKKYGSLKKAFFEMVSHIRIRDERPVRERSEEDLKKKFPEWWAFVEFLTEDIWITAIGLLITLLGLLIEMSALLNVF